MTSNKRSNKVSLSTRAQIKMALHAAKHGFSNPIHGIVLGQNTSDKGVQVVDVVPVCHETPTKPIVDMALRLTDAYLQQPSSSSSLPSLEGRVQIIGWYTANANVSSNEDELPNASACRIVSSMAESSASSADDSNESSEEFVLLLVSTSKLVDSVENKKGGASLFPICAVFEKDKSRAFAQRVDADRILLTTDDATDASSASILSNAMEQQLSLAHHHGGDAADAAAAAAGGEQKDSIVSSICDYVDHLNDCGKGDWIENEVVNKLVQ